MRLFIIFLITSLFTASVFQPVSIAYARVQSISITKVVDESSTKETLFIIVTSDSTYHILVKASIDFIGGETLVNLTATIVNPHNASIQVSAAIPDILYDHPYLPEVEAIHFHIPEEYVENLVYLILPIVVIAAVVVQVLMILEDISAYALNVLLNQVPFVWASIPYVLHTLLINDSNDDDTGTHTWWPYPDDKYELGSFDFYIPFLPMLYHVLLVLESHYYVATSKSWWEIIEREFFVYVFGFKIVLFKCYDAVWTTTRLEPPTPKSPYASFEWEPIRPIAGQEITFVSSSFDPDGIIESYHWWLGDGNESTKKSFNHAYQHSGNFSVTLEVMDDSNMEDNVTQIISVQPRAKASLRVVPTQLTIHVTKGHVATERLVVMETINETDLYGVAFQSNGLHSLEGFMLSLGNITFDKNGIIVSQGSYENITMTIQAPQDLPISWYYGNITASSENGGNATIFVELRVRMAGDISFDGKVDVVDISIVANAFGTFPGHPRWNSLADENGDERIDIIDIVIIASHFGEADC